MVAGNLFISVVHKMNTTFSGGSSSVFNRALNALSVNICTSSMIYTFRLPTMAGYFTLSRKSLISSTRLLLAASISNMSVLLTCAKPLHTSHSPQGEPFLLCKQLIALAKILAHDVLPVPRLPVNRYAWLISSFMTWFLSVVTMLSCPITSSKVFGLYFLYNAKCISILLSILCLYSWLKFAWLLASGCPLSWSWCA